MSDEKKTKSQHAREFNQANHNKLWWRNINTLLLFQKICLQAAIEWAIDPRGAIDYTYQNLRQYLNIFKKIQHPVTKPLSCCGHTWYELFFVKWPQKSHPEILARPLRTSYISISIATRNTNNFLWKLKHSNEIWCSFTNMSIFNDTSQFCFYVFHTRVNIL